MTGKKYFGVMRAKGRITIPQDVRVRLGLKAGDRLEFVCDDDRTLIRRAENPFDAYIGVTGRFPGGLNGIRRWISDLRDAEDSEERKASAIIATPPRNPLGFFAPSR